MTMDDRLPSAPDPWTSSEMPSRRDAPPYHMTDMIEAEPALTARLLTRLADPAGGAARLAAAVRASAEAAQPILVTGCGTSEHGALATVEILREQMRTAKLPWRVGEAGTVAAVQAFEGSLEDWLGSFGGLVIGVSHEGGTWATNRALATARASGATLALLTVSDRSPGAAIADIVVATEELDQSWCHTVGYLSPMVAAIAVAGHLVAAQVDPAAARALLDAALTPESVTATEAMAANLAGVQRLIVVATGVDRPAARELVLKVEEGAHLPAAMRDVETLLHGHLAGMDAQTGLVLILTESAQAEARASRATGVLRAAAELGIPAGAILSERHAEAVPARLTPAGRLVVPAAAGLTPAAASLLGSAVPLQLLTERLARARGVDPDPIRRDDPAYLRAADAAG
jgi:glucosamine 6-phosphate synthetase-like amidotransferase/phosphosugar isomerase protein